MRLSRKPNRPFGDRRWISVRETGEILGLQPKSIYDMINAGTIPACRIGRTVRIDRVALEADLERQAQGRPVGAERAG